MATALAIGEYPVASFLPLAPELVEQGPERVRELFSRAVSDCLGNTSSDLKPAWYRPPDETGVPFRFRGVTKHKRTMRYEAHVWESKKQIYLGGFLREVDAALAHDLMALWCKGPSAAPINFPADRYASVTPFFEHVDQPDVISALRAYSRAQSGAERPPRAAVPKAAAKAAKGKRGKLAGVAKAVAKTIKRPLQRLSGRGGAEADGEAAAGAGGLSAPDDAGDGFSLADSTAYARYADAAGGDGGAYAHYVGDDAGARPAYLRYDHVLPSEGHSAASQRHGAPAARARADLSPRAGQTPAGDAGWGVVEQADPVRCADDAYAYARVRAGPSHPEAVYCPAGPGGYVTPAASAGYDAANSTVASLQDMAAYANWSGGVEEAALVAEEQGENGHAPYPAAAARGLAPQAPACYEARAGSGGYGHSDTTGASGSDGDMRRANSTPARDLAGAPTLAHAAAALAPPTLVEGRSSSWSCAASRRAQFGAAAQAAQAGFAPDQAALAANVPWGCAAPDARAPAYAEGPYAADPAAAQFRRPARNASDVPNEVCGAIQRLISSSNADARARQTAVAERDHAARSAEAERFAVGFGALSNGAAFGAESNSHSLPPQLPSMVRAGSYPRTQAWGASTPQAPGLGAGGAPTTPALLAAPQAPLASASPALPDPFAQPTAIGAPWGARPAPSPQRDLAPKAGRQLPPPTPFARISPGTVGLTAALYGASPAAPHPMAPAPQMVSHGSGPAVLQGHFAHALYQQRAPRQGDAGDGAPGGAYASGLVHGLAAYGSGSLAAQLSSAVLEPPPAQPPAQRAPYAPPAPLQPHSGGTFAPQPSGEATAYGSRLQRNSVPTPAALAIEVAPRSESFPQVAHGAGEAHIDVDALSFFSTPTLDEPRRELQAQLPLAGLSPEGNGLPMARAFPPPATVPETHEVHSWQGGVAASPALVQAHDPRRNAFVAEALSLVSSPVAAAEWAGAWDCRAGGPPAPPAPLRVEPPPLAPWDAQCASVAGPVTPPSARSPAATALCVPFGASPTAPAPHSSGRCSPGEGSPSYWSVESRCAGVEPAAGLPPTYGAVPGGLCGAPAAGSPSALAALVVRDAGSFTQGTPHQLGPPTPEEGVKTLGGPRSLEAGRTLAEAVADPSFASHVANAVHG